MNPIPRTRLTVIVLAAGFSARLGEPKALARIHGTSLMQKTLRLVAALRCNRIVVVVPRAHHRYRIAAHGIKAVFVANRHRSQGLSSSVRCGVAKARYAPAVLLLPVDLPRLKRREITRLVDRWRASPRLVIARRADVRGAVPLILPRRFYPMTARIRGDVGLRDWVNQLPVASRVLIQLPSAEQDVDTREDLRAARETRYGFGASGS
jgi:molybdenum cofactor cytidylyltransferase